MRKIFIIILLFKGLLIQAQKTTTVQSKTPSHNTSTLQKDPAGKEKEYMSIEEYEMKYNRGSLMVFTNTDQPAEFPGGVDSLNAFLRSNIHYPTGAKEKKVGGKCEVKFIVQRDGSISDATIVNGISNCSECNEEAIRVVLSMPHWKPAMSDGKPVNVYYTLPISFEP